MKLPLITRWFGEPIPDDVSISCTHAEAVELTDEAWFDEMGRPLTGCVVRRVDAAGTPFLDLFWKHTK